VKFRLNIPWSSVVAIAAGVVVLLGYFLAPTTLENRSLLQNLREFFLQSAVILAAVAMLIALVNLARVHLGKIRTPQGDRLSSGIILFAMLATLLLASADYFLGWMEDPASSLGQFVFRNVQLPVERSLMALLAVALAYAAIRMLRTKRNGFTLVFLAVFLVILLGTGLDIPYLSDQLQPWIANVWALAGIRGLLLGIGLGALAAGLRVLSGVDRPYGG
jgi:hypothetical protein